jgi:CheY-like chemotaxis protein
MPTHLVVLVVDDDIEVRRSVVDALESDGMTVIDAASGQEALRILGGDPTICLLLTDIMMPGITGITLAERAAEIRPDVKIILMTAYAPQDVVRATTPLIEKPFGLDELCHTIRFACGAS